jgi:hypothetical protein
MDEVFNAPLICASQEARGNALLAYNQIFFECFDGLISQKLFLTVNSLRGFRGNLDQYFRKAQIMRMGIPVIAPNHHIRLIQPLILGRSKANLEIEDKHLAWFVPQVRAQRKGKVQPDLMAV